MLLLVLLVVVFVVVVGGGGDGVAVVLSSMPQARWVTFKMNAFRQFGPRRWAKHHRICQMTSWGATP